MPTRRFRKRGGNGTDTPPAQGLMDQANGVFTTMIDATKKAATSVKDVTENAVTSVKDVTENAVTSAKAAVAQPANT